MKEDSVLDFLDSSNDENVLIETSNIKILKNRYCVMLAGKTPLAYGMNIIHDNYVLFLSNFVEFEGFNPGIVSDKFKYSYIVSSSLNSLNWYRCLVSCKKSCIITNEMLNKDFGTNKVSDEEMYDFYETKDLIREHNFRKVLDDVDIRKYKERWLEYSKSRQLT